MPEFEDDGALYRNGRDCEKSAGTLRQLLGVPAGPLPHIMDVLDRARSGISEVKGFELVPRPDEVLGSALAYAKSKEREIVVRQSIAEAAITDEPIARYVLLHELQHLIFHPGRRRFRIAGGNETFRFLTNETSVEWQADFITRALLMPPDMVRAATSARSLAELARVPLDEAIARFHVVRGGPETKFEEEAESGQPSAVSKFDALKLKLWKELPTIPGENPAHSRLCGMYRIHWSEYEKTTQCGWYLSRGRVVAFFPPA